MNFVKNITGIHNKLKYSNVLRYELLRPEAFWISLILNTADIVELSPMPMIIEFVPIIEGKKYTEAIRNMLENRYIQKDLASLPIEFKTLVEI